jgi:hypothetical protein
LTLGFIVLPFILVGSLRILPTLDALNHLNRFPRTLKADANERTRYVLVAAFHHLACVIVGFAAE